MNVIIYPYPKSTAGLINHCQYKMFWHNNDILIKVSADWGVAETIRLALKPKYFKRITLQWRHNEHDSVSNHQLHDCLLNRLFGRRSKKTSKLRVTGLCAGNSPGTSEFPAQMCSNAENVSIWWRHHVVIPQMLKPWFLAPPGHQHLWYQLYGMNESFASRAMISSACNINGCL